MNRTDAIRYRRSDTIHGLFAHCVRATPDAVALIHGDRRISYRDLDTLARGYAADLEALGVGPGDMVPLLIPRGIEMVAAMLAILRRGAAYAVLDPAWPRTRRKELIAALAGPILITDDASWPQRRWQPAAQVTGGQPTPVEVRGSDPAMVFFTSGSTGTPKGAILPHHGTARLFDGDPFQPYGPGIVQAQTMPLHWDGSILDLWSSLLSGGTAILLDEVMQPQVLRRVIREHGVNAAGFLPGALFNLIVDEDVDAFAGLRFLGIGGERLSPRHVAAFLKRHPDIALTNVYGPVESTALVTAHRIAAADPGVDIPLGHPVNASNVYVFDGDRRCAPGETGELCLAGDGLAVAYLHNPQLTARHFVTVDIDGAPMRVYRTGDLGCVGPDGVFAYLGRGDRQVKISGHRIEPGEVERHAEAVPGVLRGAVVPTRGPDGTLRGLRLCYVGTADPEALRRTLADRLPAYLVPAEVSRLDALPLTANGKVDYATLASHGKLGYVEVGAPCGGERAAGNDDPVAAIFRSVLGVAGIGGADSFFDLGGTSLEAARLCARIAGTLGVTVPVSQIYRTPTVAGLTSWLAGEGPEPEGIHPESADGDALIPLGVGPANYIDATNGTICVTTWRVSGPLDEEALAAALNDIHHRHPSLHTRYLRTDPPAARIPDRIEPVEIRVLAAGKHRGECGPDTVGTRHDLNQAIQEPLDITQGRVWRAVIGEPEADGGRWFGIGVHHIAFDAWSLDLLVADLSHAYAARLRNDAPRWTDVAPGPAELAEESAHLRTIDLDAQRRHWQRHLRTMPRVALPGLPRGPLPPTGPTEGPRLTVTEAELAAWDAYGSRFAGLLAICGATLREVTGQTDIGVLVPVAMRGNPVADAAITCRINPVVLRLSTHEGVPARIKEALAAADLPFGAVVAAVAAVRPDLHALLTLPIFLLQDRPTEVLTLAGCRVDLIEDRAAQDIPSPLAIEVVLTETGANLNVGVRTDLLPRSLADEVAARYLSILRAGPQASAVESLQRSNA